LETICNSSSHSSNNQQWVDLVAFNSLQQIKINSEDSNQLHNNHHLEAHSSNNSEVFSNKIKINNNLVDLVQVKTKMHKINLEISKVQIVIKTIKIKTCLQMD